MVQSSKFKKAQKNPVAELVEATQNKIPGPFLAPRDVDFYFSSQPYGACDIFDLCLTGHATGVRCQRALRGSKLFLKLKLHERGKQFYGFR